MERSSGSVAAPDPVRREAARVVLLDDRDRLLLFRGCDPDRPAATFWFTVGGGIEPGETPEQCARREAAEETGLRDLDLGPLVWTRVARFTWGGVPYEQHETFFLARCADHEVDTSGFTPEETASYLDHRWWTLAELEATRDLLSPPDLPAQLRTLLRDGVPSMPVQVGGAVAP